MNKQEAIERIKNIDTLNINDRVAGQQVDMVMKNPVLGIISLIDEPQRVVVPAFIDSFIGYAKAEGMSLFIAMDNAQNKESEWIITHEETFARAWLDGYEIEQEKLYKVEVPNNGGTLVLARVNQSIKLVDGNKRFPGKFTKELIENAGFYWALKWAKEVKE